MNWKKLAGGIYRAARLLLGLILLLALAAFLYLSVQGVPRRCVNRWLNALRSQGHCVTVERIRLDPLEGIVAERFRWFEDRNQLLPMLEADRVALFLNPCAWFRQATGLRRLRVSGACLRLGLVAHPTSDADALVLRNVSGGVIFGEDAWHLNDVTADLLGLQITCRGEIRLGRAAAPAAARQDAAVPRMLNALTRAQRERILELARQLNAITFGIPPRADIAFQLDTDNPEVNEAALRMEGAATCAFGMRFDHWQLRAELKDGRARLVEAGLQQQGQRLDCSGSYVFSNRVVEARLRGRLIPEDWAALAPRAWRDALKQSGLALRGPIQCDICLDPCPVEQAPDHLHGWLTLTKADARGVWIEQGLAGFTTGESTVHVDPFYALLGKGPGQGPAQGQLSYAWDTGDYEGRLDAQFDPQILAPLLNSNLAAFAGAFVFPERPPAGELDFSGRTGRDDALWLAGSLRASNFTYQTVPVTAFESRIGYAAGRLAFDGARLVRPEGEVTGWLTADPDGAALDLDLVSTANPRAIARIIGPEVAADLAGFHFAGPMRIAVRGRLDYGAGTRTDLRAEIAGRDWGYAPFHATRADLEIAVKQSRFDLANIRGEAYEGAFSGKAAFYPAGAAANFRYEAEAQADNLNLNTLLQALGYQGREEYEGQVYAACALAGSIGPGQGQTAAGGGWLRIQDGQLYQLRLLGGFSRLLSIIYPGLGTVSLTDFAANFTVKDRKIDTPDAVLSGPTLAIHGKGYCAFDEQLDFILWAQAPDRRHYLPRLSQATAPLFTRLLAVRLTGTAADPKWWPLNLTRDQLLALPKDILITMPKDVLLGLPHDLLVSLPREVLVTLPRDILVTLPKRVFLDLPEELFIKLPQDIWNVLRPAPAKPATAPAAQ